MVGALHTPKNSPIKTQPIEQSAEWLFVVGKQPRLITIIVLIEECKLAVPVYILSMTLCHYTFNEVSVATEP